MTISLGKVAQELNKNDYFYILTHQYPDGDTLGSACAICKTLQKIGKKAKIINNDDIPSKYKYLFNNIIPEDFDFRYIISVDVADTSLLGEGLYKYKDKIDLKIDHHLNGTEFSKISYIDSSAAATAEIIYDLINDMEVKIDKDIANSIYTGISTDTGCFKYMNATPKTHIIAAKVIELGADHYLINKIMFDTKSKDRFELEKLVVNSIKYFCDSKCAFIYITNEMLIKVSINNESDLEGFASIPRKIEGVLVGVTLREKENGIFKISVRTDGNINASKICAKLGGGGHIAAAGCTLSGSTDSIEQKILEAIKNETENLL